MTVGKGDEIRQLWTAGAQAKDHIKQRVGFSPDLGDAAALTFAIDFNTVVDESKERFRPYRGSAGGQAWMGV